MIAISFSSKTGKSSFVTAIFRLVEASQGTITLDGIDISTLNLQGLRQHISIITQDPVVIHGSVRYNIDPFHQSSDDDIIKVLDICQLSQFVQSLPGQLDYQIDASGGNISLGQKQQFAMARALLKKPKLLVLDEATSSIDNRTDELMSKAINEACVDTTCLIIAHRLHTVMACDRIMVLERGELKEFDEPFEILKNKDSLLSKLVKANGKKKAAKLISIAEKKSIEKKQQQQQQQQQVSSQMHDDNLNVPPIMAASVPLSAPIDISAATSN
jgi:ATP-binding cassette subfamily C (CFTR/MRP) protein 4